MPRLWLMQELYVKIELQLLKCGLQAEHITVSYTTNLIAVW